MPGGAGVGRVGRRADWLFCALLLLSLVAGPSSAPAQTLPQFDQKAISEDYVLRLVQMATRLRSVGIVDAAKIGELFSDRDDAFAFRFPDSDGEADDILWSHFFRNTHIYFGHLKNPSPIAGYYDPFSGYWLLTRWDNSDRTPVLRASRLVPEERLRPDGKAGPAGEVPSWMLEMQTGALVKILPVHAARAARGFETGYPLDARDTPKFPQIANRRDARAGFRDRQAYFFATLLALQADEGLSLTYTRTLDAVERSDPLALHKLFGGPTHMPVSEVTAFPEALRTGLEPVAYLEGKGGGLIVSSQLDNSRWLLVTGYDEADPPKLTAIGYIDLFARGSKG